MYADPTREVRRLRQAISLRLIKTKLVCINNVMIDGNTTEDFVIAEARSSFH